MRSEAPFSKVPVTFRGWKAVLYIFRVQFAFKITYENDVKELLVNEAKLTGWWARIVLLFSWFLF